MKIKLTTLVRNLNLKCKNVQDIVLTGIACNSKHVEPGNLFICTPGYQSTFGEMRTNTHLFASEAIARGAIALVVETYLSSIYNAPQIIVRNSWEALSEISAYFYSFPTKDMETIGITGTNGKTSVAYMVESVLNNSQMKTALISTIERRYKEMRVESVNTTPEANIIHEFLFHAKQNGADYAVMEVTSHALALKRVEHVCFDVAVFTNMTQDHLNFHGSMQSYFGAKKVLFDVIEKSRGTAIINKDDAYGSQLLSDLHQASVLTYGIYTEADLKAENVKQVGMNIEFDLIYKGMNYSAQLPFVGEHYVYNCLSAIAVGVHYGQDVKKILLSLSQASIPGRFEVIQSSHPSEIVIDFAHSPDGVEKVLSISKEICRGRLIVVFGCGGDRDILKRPIMGKIVDKYCDIAIITSDNPRNEDPEKILFDIEQGFLLSEKYKKIVDRIKAIEFSLQIGRKNDLIIILGRGHENFQKIAGNNIKLNDKEIVQNWLSTEVLLSSSNGYKKMIKI